MNINESFENFRLGRLIEYKRRKEAFQGGPFYINQGLLKISNDKFKFAKSWGIELNAAATSANTEIAKRRVTDGILSAHTFGHLSLF